jgi:hypothetical protein
MADLVRRIELAGKRRAASAAWTRRAEFDAVPAVLATDYPDPGEDAGRDALDDVADVFGLDTDAADVLWSVVASELDANVSLAYAALRGVASWCRPSVGLALELAGLPSGAPESFELLTPGGALRRHGLLDVPGDEPWLARELRVPDPVIATLAGGVPDDPAVTPLMCSVPALDLPGTEQVRRVIEHGAPLVWVQSAPGAAGGSLAAAAIEASGLSLLAIDLRRLSSPDELGTAAMAAARSAGLIGRALLVLGGEALTGSTDYGAVRTLAHAAVPVVIVSSRPWNPSWLPSFPLVLDAEPMSAAHRAGMWRDALGEVFEADADLRQVLLGLRLGPEDANETGRYARLLSVADARRVDGDLVREAARRVGGTRGSAATRVPGSAGAVGRPTFDDLVLPEAVISELRRMVTWGRHRNEVAAHGPLRRHGRGIAALFAGSPGTGKTLAAHVVAEELSVDLFQVELATVVDKYIGETEKNLERVFAAAEALDVVLFFDEADALFGARSEVRDARDRYANQEIAYLLQRMEAYEGITILATNLRGNLDRAFSRRMSFIVHFPDPDPPTRRRLWLQHLAQLPALDPDDPVQVDSLAQGVEVTGGDIRNIVLAAAYDATGAGEPVGMRHVAAATVREYRKLGRVVPEHAFTAVS